MKLCIFILLANFCFHTLPAYALVSDWNSSLPYNSKFNVSDEMRNRVDFWVKIYSQYSTTQGVFHLTDKPEVILGEIDLTSIYQNTNLSDSVKRNLIEKKVKNLKKFYVQKYSLSPNKVRLQMGLKDRMKKALYLSGKYINSMESIFKREGLPIELTRLVYVESSFNIFAQSKVGASGLWQIMPSVARPRGYLAVNYDKRNHPIYATELAALILKKNYSVLKTWPLAITAYNHGLAGVQRMVNKNGTTRIEKLISSKATTRSWGFASKNFYACFLAVLEVERNAPHLFGQNLVKANSINLREYKLPYRIHKSEILKWYGGSLTRFKQMNPHLNWRAFSNKSSMPAGIPLMVPQKQFSLVRN